MASSLWSHMLATAGVCTVLVIQQAARGDEPVRLVERWAVGDQYSVRSRSEVTGTLTLPAEKDKPAPAPLSMRGDSVIEYDERVLGLASNGAVDRTVRICRRVEFRRTVKDQEQKSTLRDGVRRLVVLREGRLKAPFSPDGPLTWGEIDLVRTDIFVPVLVGLLPPNPVRVNETWTAAPDAVQELTGLASIEDGKLECRLEEIAEQGQRRIARVGLSGTVKGLSDDGTSRQSIKGHYLFEVDAGRLTYVEIRGKHALLDGSGKEVGAIEGRFILSRQPDTNAAELSEANLRGAALVPDADHTLLLYDNPDLGVRFLYPRRWKVAGVSGNQVGVDAPDGSGFLLTLEALNRTPTLDQFLAESRGFLEKGKARILRVDPPRVAPNDPTRGHFALEVEMNGQKSLMDYHVNRQAQGGVVIAARLLPREQETLQRELERIAASVVITKRIEERK